MISHPAITLLEIPPSFVTTSETHHRPKDRCRAFFPKLLNKRQRLPFAMEPPIRSEQLARLLLALIGVLHLCSLGVRAQNCYYPNGDLSTEGDGPCSSEPDSPCCPLNWQCLSNGLCYLENAGYLGRYTCTDRTWKSSNCPQICTHGSLLRLLCFANDAGARFCH